MSILAARATVLALALAALLPAAALAGDAPVIQVLSNRADLISGGDALVAVALPDGADPGAVKMRLNGDDITSAFALRANGRYEGLVTGLAVGDNTLQAVVPGAGQDTATIVDHANGGPVVAGPQVLPWVCQAGAKDAKCNQPATYAYTYKSSTTGQMGAYDPKSPPSDVATTTTDQGKTVPYIVRTETGYQDRDQYSISILDDPSKPFAPWQPQDGFNHKLVIEHGASCGIDHQTGSAPSTNDGAALSRGFAVMSTALDNAGHNCNTITEAESLIMAKERLVEEYGTLRYTIGTGCSGGSLVQQQVANAYPGIYQGILPQCSFPDNWSTGQQLVDYHLDRAYFEDPSKWGTGVFWTPAQMAAVEGHPNHANAIILDTLYWTALADPTNACAGVTAAQRYDPQTNKNGVRCTLADYQINVFGPRPDGFAGRPIDNVGVQYGLGALQQGIITPAQFADLNAKIGGGDIDINPTPARTEADQPALARAYRAGAINEANNLDQVAIIDLRGSDEGSFHDAYRAFAIRARLEREHGTYANQVIWRGPAPLLGGADYTTSGLVAIDRWLAAVEKDASDKPLAAKIIADRPTDVHDECNLGEQGTTALPDAACPAVVRVYSTPRIVAGESIATDTNKCRLKPLRRSDYTFATNPSAFSDADWTALQSTFPSGVCDWNQTGVSQQPTIPWQTYQGDAAGTDVIYGGKSLGAAPAASGSGWTAPAFASWLKAEPGA
jgi:hypothetical protein